MLCRHEEADWLLIVTLFTTLLTEESPGEMVTAFFTYLPVSCDETARYCLYIKGPQFKIPTQHRFWQNLFTTPLKRTKPTFWLPEKHIIQLQKKLRAPSNICTQLQNKFTPHSMIIQVIRDRQQLRVFPTDE